MKKVERNIRVLRFTRWFALAAVLATFGLAFQQMHEERHDSGWHVPLDSLSDSAEYFDRTLESGSYSWQFTLWAMLVWIAAAVAEKYLSAEHQHDGPAADYK